jgi:hypothetical protein
MRGWMALALGLIGYWLSIALLRSVLCYMLLYLLYAYVV